MQSWPRIHVLRARHAQLFKEANDLDAVRFGVGFDSGALTGEAVSVQLALATHSQVGKRFDFHARRIAKPGIVVKQILRILLSSLFLVVISH